MLEIMGLIVALCVKVGTDIATNIENPLQSSNSYSEPLAIEAVRLSRMQGHQRRLERIQNIKRYLHQQTLKFGKAEMGLDQALNGPIEQWNINV